MQAAGDSRGRPAALQLRPECFCKTRVRVRTTTELFWRRSQLVNNLLEEFSHFSGVKRSLAQFLALLPRSRFSQTAS